MKNNLKNRPRPLAYVENVRIMEDWFEGFENELRKKLVHPTNTKSIEVYDFIKQILGEVEK